MSDVNYTFKFCSQCGNAKSLDCFYTKSSNKDGRRAECIDCTKVYSDATAEHRKAKARERYQQTKEKIITYQKEYRAKNAELVRESALKRHRKNRDHRLAVMRASRKNNPEKARAQDQAKRSKRASRPGSHTAADIRALLKAQRRKCAVCHADVGNGYHVDHIEPLSKGGTNDKLNLQVLCPSCNTSKSAKDPLLFMQSRGFLL